MDNVNEGHRQRLRERFEREGLDGFLDHEVLELLLFICIPYKDTNKTAHALINRFGTLANVLDAPEEMLAEVCGVSKVTATNLKIMRALMQRYKQSSAERVGLGKLSEIIAYAKELLDGTVKECLVAVYVDNSTCYSGKSVFTSKAREYVYVSPKDIVAGAMKYDAAGVILFHCHVKGSVIPSETDITYTENLYVTLAGMNIVLLEHIIFNENDYYSFVAHGKIEEFAGKYRRLTE